MTEGLTVVVPNYNKEPYLTKCIESIIAQTYKPAAVIIVDDASTDGSGEIIDRLTKRYPSVRAHYKPENSGVSNTRNLGLSLVDTEYVTFIDADDYYFNPEKLALEMNLQKEKGGDIIAYSAVKFINPEGKSNSKLRDKSYYLSGNVYEDLLITKKWDSIMRDYILKTETLRAAGGYDTTRSLFEDFELLLVLARDHEFYCTGEFGTAYNEGRGLSSVDKEDHTKIMDELIEKELERSDEKTRKRIRRKRRLACLDRKIRSLL
ncbi:MAG: glycosyltransferase family 2 protein [Lachnospiraceae bacterium]|nr:glycosyltransferase family 2 protein [Lachnospiraceae bacterium]